MRLLRREDGKLIVMGLDYFDETPVLDIKPYRNDYTTDGFELAEWYRNLRDRAGREV